MRPFMEQLEKNCAAFPCRLALALDYRREAVTYGELWHLSGKVYAYLKKHHIGKEDFVLINLPRGPKISVALIGIWRAGAAGTVTEADYPAERVEYISRDCRAKLIINEKIYREMLEEEPCSGYEKAAPQDACYAVYTSGTTGNPKGALHEYGKLDLCVKSYPKEPGWKYGEGYRHAATYPLNFVIYFVWLVSQLYLGTSFYVLSYEIIKNMNTFTRFIADEKITEFFMSPTLLKVYKDIPSTLHFIFTGSDNVSELYFSDASLKNGYGMSETAAFVTAYTIDKPYHRTPVGKSTYGLQIEILNDEGNPAEAGEHGEVCFQNEYFRGYINLPEQTEKILRGGIFHTGDLGHKDEDGNLYIVGRKDDMIKIHGNRVEPEEIEIAAKNALDVKNIIAKGFAQSSNAFIVLYGLASEIGDSFAEKNLPVLREKLARHLPPYMIPNYYIAMEKFPTNANGKVSRRLFPEPEAKSNSGEYAAPLTDTERAICEKMASVLGLEKISRRADFYQMGGDSLKTILLVTACEGLPLTSNDVYKYRTPERLAAFCEENSSPSQEGERFSPLQALQEKVFPEIRESYQSYLKTGQVTSRYSSFFALKEETIRQIAGSPAIEVILQEEVKPSRLQKAVDKALEVCPYVAFDIAKDSGLVHFQKTGSPFLVQKAGTLKEFGTDNHYAAVEYDGDKIIFTVSHILTDGFGINAFVQAVLDFYFGKQSTFYHGPEAFDFVADLMAQELPLPEGYKPADYRIANHFIPPEINSSGEARECFMEIPAQEFEDFCQLHKISGQIALALLVARAIQKAHPDNTDVISIRGPVNTRVPLHVPNSFQNSSIPHIFLNIEPGCLTGASQDTALDKLKGDFAEQYTYENLAAFTNRTRDFFTTEDSAKRAAIVENYKTQTDILANYMGKVLPDDIAPSVKSFRQKVSASYPLMVYALQYGEIIGLQIVQAFASPVYIESLREVLQGEKML